MFIWLYAEENYKMVNEGVVLFQLLYVFIKYLIHQY
jgi:hypothetical protein